jgi:hypothetical protein
MRGAESPVELFVAFDERRVRRPSPVGLHVSPGAAGCNQGSDDGGGGPDGGTTDCDERARNTPRVSLGRRSRTCAPPRPAGPASSADPAPSALFKTRASQETARRISVSLRSAAGNCRTGVGDSYTSSGSCTGLHCSRTRPGTRPRLGRPLFGAGAALPLAKAIHATGRSAFATAFIHKPYRMTLTSGRPRAARQKPYYSASRPRPGPLSSRD